MSSVVDSNHIITMNIYFLIIVPIGILPLNKNSKLKYVFSYSNFGKANKAIIIVPIGILPLNKKKSESKYRFLILPILK